MNVVSGNCLYLIGTMGTQCASLNSVKVGGVVAIGSYHTTEEIHLGLNRPPVI